MFRENTLILTLTAGALRGHALSLRFNLTENQQEGLAS
ncbi:MAG: hypothetical protein J07HQW1_02316 [Haloquadratum walsbyi J07HQW1]|jgi:hypothetical protein|uniref:Uncharacterized protein n=1 Tax=Haloquadratum walsbyi J07HQW1 TaxID=1238424 RepID=U1PJC1_9EURY|nr:MAG: hypothetical protein J07HQW1_02316 [Haloquadratum walsbyi J07HQW1]